MKHVERFLSLALALVLCLGLAACGESNSNEDYGDDGSDYNLYGVPDSIEGWSRTVNRWQICTYTAAHGQVRTMVR